MHQRARNKRRIESRKELHANGLHQKQSKGRGRNTKISKAETNQMLNARREARISSGLTLAQLAKRVGVSRQYLAHCERHGASFGLSLRLAAVLKSDLSLYLWPEAAVGTPRRSR